VLPWEVCRAAPSVIFARRYDARREADGRTAFAGAVPGVTAGTASGRYRGSRARPARAEEALTKIRNGLGGRYYKTRQQVGTKAAPILAGHVAGLIQAVGYGRYGYCTSPLHTEGRLVNER
jgi:hypothetical protein